jgi:hypothetical protein
MNWDLLQIVVPIACMMLVFAGMFTVRWHSQWTKMEDTLSNHRRCIERLISEMHNHQRVTERIREDVDNLEARIEDYRDEVRSLVQPEREPEEILTRAEKRARRRRRLGCKEKTWWDRLDTKD